MQSQSQAQAFFKWSIDSKGTRLTLHIHWEHIIQVGYTRSCLFGFPYIFLSTSGAICFQQYFLKQFASIFCFCLIKSFWALTSLQLNSAYQRSSLMEILMDNQTGLQNCWQSHSCPKNVCCYIKYISSYRVNKHPSTPHTTRGSPWSEENNKSKIYLWLCQNGILCWDK